MSDFRKLALTIDARYWERRAETARENPEPKKHDSGKSNNSGGNSGNNSNQKGKQPERKGNNNNNNSSNTNKPANSGSSNSTPPKKPDLSNKLGKDGKLTPEERARRIEKNLCLFYGAPGHTARDCTRPTSSAAKARSARAEKSEATPDSKKE